MATPVGDAELCVVCGYRRVDNGRVCTRDRDLIETWLVDLLRQLYLLNLQLVPGQPDRGQHVTARRAVAPIPGRLDVLNLTAAGCTHPHADYTTLHPLVRHWQTSRTVTVTARVGDTIRTSTHRIPQWHTELVRDDQGRAVHLAHDDQVGQTPPREWLDWWVRRWRVALGHTRRRPATPGGQWAPTQQQAAALAEALLSPTTRPHVVPAAAAYLAIRRAWVQAAGDATTGMGAAIPRGARPEDPLRDEWEVRFGEPTHDLAAAHDVRYLLHWLDAACERDLGMSEFATGLAALHAELTIVLGEQPDLVWLGRCPSSILDHDSGQCGPCGAGLWQDRTERLSQVKCPRCRATWGGARPVDAEHLEPDSTSRPVELLELAAEIRRVWPVDRRRRYPTREARAVRVPRCPGCGEQITVTWVDATEPGERTRMWRPARADCPTHCGHAGRILS